MARNIHYDKDDFPGNQGIARKRLDRYKTLLSNAMAKGKLKPLMMDTGDIEL